MKKRHINEMRPNAVELFGPLTEVLQVKASIALASIPRNGWLVDTERATRIRQQLSAEIQRNISLIVDMPDYSNLFILPSQATVSKQRRLELLLLRVTKEVMVRSGKKIVPPLNERGQIALGPKKWKPYRSDHPFLEAWIDMERASKLMQFTALRDPVARTHYRCLVRNGRTSCTAPNIQQMPRAGGFREAFHARAGHVLLICDYSFIELCTLAVVCEQRFGFSMLGSVIRRGIDPHCFTAAMFEGIELEAFMKWRDGTPEQRERFKALRQRAKAINFGIPGGEGALALQEYALSAYGVEITLDESKTFRELLIRKVYPELSLYLFEDCMDLLATRLHVSAAQCWRRFAKNRPWNVAIGLAIRNVVEGQTCRKDGKPYRKQLMSSVWRGLKSLNRNAELTPIINRAAARSLAIIETMGTSKTRAKTTAANSTPFNKHPGWLGDAELCKRLFGSDVTTLTGRVRGGVTFTQVYHHALSLSLSLVCWWVAALPNGAMGCRAAIRHSRGWLPTEPSSHSSTSFTLATGWWHSSMTRWWSRSPRHPMSTARRESWTRSCARACNKSRATFPSSASTQRRQYGPSRRSLCSSMAS